MTEADEVKRREKKEKKEKRRSESDGVHKAKKDKKEKKSKKEKLAQALDEHLQASAAASAAEDMPISNGQDHSDGERPATSKIVVRGALVDFALPITNEKSQKKVYKAVKKAAKSNALLRGIKEVNKALRKAPPKTPSSTASTIPGVVVIAGDISPPEVVMHLPLACEDVNAPYIFVPSRAELGASAKTKRPTSVIMMLPRGKKSKAAAADGEDAKEYAESFSEVSQLVQKEYAKQMRGRI